MPSRPGWWGDTETMCWIKECKEEKINMRFVLHTMILTGVIETLWIQNEKNIFSLSRCIPYKITSKMIKNQCLILSSDGKWNIHVQLQTQTSYRSCVSPEISVVLTQVRMWLQRLQKALQPAQSLLNEKSEPGLAHLKRIFLEEKKTRFKTLQRDLCYNFVLSVRYFW